ncbi:sugar ABC transporter substrate-binding protein [Bifidobacterium pseudolongum]|uniref:Sugar ABC transporter substrate-binding protein n=1 Tax=Bifidobacterium pseudolongum TaxID=1694 RepID=A0AB37NYS5_9BIFI|nr:sugar ABC transporter substrate-binding protein [Bifidobacterium pseudolongum]MCI1194283.1 sugar ABC transporter substrate-binding protein [Bifidobacterium pseudolongum subsp. globosum]NBH69104.1 sugar ABC transporter substrate-binding protein [Bifidobacterium pseudolongum]RKI89232.1 sugar ABC transporter substrate-binding protein [Bifidobacterium pseudolongum]UNP93798.1 sugar ABC transporter substrate-binding protein [Bifidobacterium pseudolongum subsp. globosum]UNZ10407.1 sugar ABC transp
MVAAVCAAGMMLAVAGCGEHDDRTQISVWSWEPSMAALIADFEARNPDVHVTQIGTADYSKLNSAIQDGYGTPDVVQLEYFALPQYAVSGQLRDLTSRTTNYGSFYTPGSWSSVQLDGRVYGVPMDSGPMAFFYNQDVFEQAGVDAAKIRTWDDYYRAAKKLKENGVYIAADDGDASFYNAMIWLAGGRPYNTSHDGKEVSITLDTDTGTQEFTRFWQQMIDEDLVNTRLDTWSDDWKQALGSGTVASLFAGAWMPSLLLADVPGTAGLWRVAQMPTAHGNLTNAENGGSALGVLSSSRRPEASWRFIEYVCHETAGIMTRVDGGAFPADNATLNSANFLNKTTVRDARGIEVPYFGGQKFNTVLAQAASHVSTGYQYLPFEVYARSDFRATVGAAYTWVNDEHRYYDAVRREREGLIQRKDMPQSPGPQVTLREGIERWQSDLKEYGANQGFTMR